MTHVRWVSREAANATRAESGTFPDRASAQVSVAVTPRLSLVVRLVCAMVASRGSDSRVARGVVEWVCKEEQFVVVRTQFQAARSPSRSLTTLKLLRLVVGLLGRVSAVLRREMAERVGGSVCV